MVKMTDYLDVMCVYGPKEHPAQRYQSGRPVCWPCWNWNKLDHPAALHWAKVAEGFLSNVDAYDLTNYLPACGLTKDEAVAVLEGAQKILEHSRLILEGPPAGREE